ncbi:MAG: DMT family transporter [Tagaea sp.]|nr:DMT family transporter [Tagaea sp.]
MSRASREGPWLLLSLALLWGVNWPAMKLAVLEMGPWTFRVICLYVGALGLFAIAWKLGLSMRVPRGRGRELIVASLLNVTIWHVCSAYGLMLVEAGRASLIAFTMPIWVGVFGAVFLGEILDARKTAALALGALGLALLAMPAFAGLAASPLGFFLMLACAVGWATGTLYLKRRGFGMNAVSLTAWQLAIGGVPVLLGMLAIDVPAGIWRVETPSLAGWVGIVYAATVPMIYCHWAWFRALEILPAQAASLGVLAVPVVGVASSAWLTGERFAALDYAGMAAILAALFMAMAVRPASSNA